MGSTFNVKIWQEDETFAPEGWRLLASHKVIGIDACENFLLFQMSQIIPKPFEGKPRGHYDTHDIPFFWYSMVKGMDLGLGIGLG